MHPDDIHAAADELIHGPNMLPVLKLFKKKLMMRVRSHEMAEP